MTDGQDTPRAVGIAEAARLLGLSPGAVRKRVQRGTLPSVKSADGTWLVLIEQIAPIKREISPHDREIQSHDELVAQLRDENAFLRGLLEQLAQPREDATVVPSVGPGATEPGDAAPIPNGVAASYAAVLWRRIRRRDRARPSGSS